jgi:hypothetical protein
MSFADTRRRMIEKHGVVMTLTRGDAWVKMKGALSNYRPDQLVGALTNADCRLEICNDTFELGQPINPDLITTADGRVYTVKFANPVIANSELIGYSCVVVGN